MKRSSHLVWLASALFLVSIGLPSTWAEDSSKAKEQAPATDPIARIKAEGLERSEVLKTLSYLSDVIGPRLTNSPQLKRANEWTRDKMAEWGLENARVEPWGEFGRGWTLKRFSLQVVEPQCIPLIALPKAWSPGLEGGPKTAKLVRFDAKKPADLEKYRGQLQGAIVLIGATRELKAGFDPTAIRQSDQRLLDLANAPHPDAVKAIQPTPTRRPSARRRGPSPREFLAQRDQFLMDEGALAILEPSAKGDGGTIFVTGALVRTTSEEQVRAWHSEAPAILPQIVIAIEHFNRLNRMLEAGEEVRVELDLEADFLDDDLIASNTIAEIPGTDKKDEVVMLGGHLDSWHGASGATDNAAGVAVCMEAVRILKALDLKPRRTIRVALWTGEEQGLLGSRAYVKTNFGRFIEEDKVSNEADALAKLLADGEPGRVLEVEPTYEKFSGYFNLDNGTGKIRGVYMEGNEAIRPVFRDWLAAFQDQGASTLTLNRTSGTDHMAFDAIGLPGFQFIQDPIEYRTRSHHSNMDLFDRIQGDDLKQAAVIMATFVYQAANREDRLPRKDLPILKKPAKPQATTIAAGDR